MPSPLPDDGERFAALALWCARGADRKKIRALRSSGCSPEAVLEGVPGAREAGLRALEDLRRRNSWVLLPGDHQWSEVFGRTEPEIGALFVRGELPPTDHLSVGVVGSRQATHYGRVFAFDLSAALTADGCTIVSGGALGIDGSAHRGALAEGGTVVVLAGGLDRLYPPAHGTLFDEVIARGGALVSESPFGTPPRAELFPRRNRIIAALSRVLVVVQAARSSGSLVTARAARRLGVPVFAVPGAPGDLVAEGTKDLLREGARLCLGPDEIRMAIGLPKAEDVRASAAMALQSVRQRPSDPALERLSQLIGVSPRPLDDLAQAAGLSANRLTVALTHLELLGLTARSPAGDVYRLTPALSARSRSVVPPVSQPT
jgi:DNA processing protein